MIVVRNVGGGGLEMPYHVVVVRNVGGGGLEMPYHVVVVRNVGGGVLGVPYRTTGRWVLGGCWNSGVSDS